MTTDQKPTQIASEHRLHISGLTPQISPADLKERFQRFGDVQKVDAVGPDALGKLSSPLQAMQKLNKSHSDSQVNRETLSI